MRASRSVHPVARRGAALTIAFALAATISTTTAVAAPPAMTLVQGDVSLEYRRENGTALCPDEAAFRERAADGFGLRDPFVAPGNAASARLRIVLLREGKRYRGVLTVLEPGGREVATTKEEHLDCDALVWVLAHRVTIAVLGKPPPPPREPPSSTPSSPVPSPARTCDARCVDASTRRILFNRVHFPVVPTALAVGGLTSLGLTPGPAPGAWIGLALQWRRTMLWAELRGSFPAVAVSFSSDRASTLGWMSAVLAPCVRWKVFVGCVFVEGGMYEYRLPTQNPTTVAGLFAMGPRAGLDVPIGANFFLRVFADLVLRPFLPRFSARLTAAGDSPVITWQVPPVGGLLTAGVGWSS